MFQQTEKIWENNGSNMLSAYYSKGCYSEKLFAEFKISQNKFYKNHLNKYNVILLDIHWMYGNAITGILPIKKYGTQSALNNFREHTMVSPRQMAEYVGFTEAEVKDLCKEHDMSFKEMQRWYDGYFFETIGHVYSPNSVIEAVDSREFGNYWSRTETYESLKTYIAINFGGLRQLIVDMLGGRSCRVDVESFQNDITSFNSADDVITLLIHMGYLAYDNKTKEVFIPNEEVRSVFLRAIRNDGWDDVIKAISASEARIL